MARQREGVAAPARTPPTGALGLAVLALVTLWLGPWCLLVGLLLLVLRPVRTALRTTFTRRVGVGLVVAVVVVAGVAVLVPDGWLPVPTGPGVLVGGPAYLGSAAEHRPVTAADPADPALGPQGDPGATGAVPAPGPLGAAVQVRTGWYGVSGCRDLATAGARDLLAVCGRSLVDVDPADLRPRSSVRLPSGGCAARIVVDAAGRAVVSGPDRALRTYTVGAHLRRVTTLDLGDVLPAGDCVVAALPDAAGRWWFTSHGGRVGTVAPGSDRVRIVRLGSGERIDTPLSVDATGAVYVVGDRAVHRFTVVRGRPHEAWRTVYDRAAGRTATAPALLSGGRVAIVDGAEPRPHLVTYDARSGRRTCAVATFRADPSEATLTVAGDVVVVGRGPSHGWFGRAGGSLTRVDADRCRVRWTRTVDLVGRAGRVSLATGLLHVVTKRPSRAGVDSWYVAGVDVRTGVTQFARRIGTGPWLDPAAGSLVLADSGAAYVGVRGGIVRVRDQPVG